MKACQMEILLVVTVTRHWHASPGHLDGLSAAERAPSPLVVQAAWAAALSLRLERPPT